MTRILTHVLFAVADFVIVRIIKVVGQFANKCKYNKFCTHSSNSRDMQHIIINVLCVCVGACLSWQVLELRSRLSTVGRSVNRFDVAHRTVVVLTQPRQRRRPFSAFLSAVCTQWNAVSGWRSLSIKLPRRCNHSVQQLYLNQTVFLERP